MNALAKAKGGEIIEAVIARGDIANLDPQERAKYYVRVCESMGLNPMTRPFEYITLNGKLTLYARKDATDQLRQLHNVSVTELAESERDGVFIVTAKVVNGNGRMDAAKGAVSINGLKGEVLANALMKAETKAKRRATLSICGLGFLDETEIDDIPVGAGKGTTLPKKDARDIYTKLQEEIRVAPTRDALSEWGVANAERIKTLPDDWAHILRLRYEERLAELRTTDAAVATVLTPPEPPPLEEPDDGSIPPILDRTKDKPKVAATAKDVFDPAQWLRDIDGALSGCEDYASAGEVQKKLITPHRKTAFPPDWDRATALLNGHLARIGQTVMDAG